jgi:glycosyltransferase involved in cell wall biosynthesis
MKIASLHYTSFPQFGGVEHVMLDQAVLLQKGGHEVTLISGTPDSNPFQAPSIYVEEINRDYPLNSSIRAVLERGQFDKVFNTYIAVLMERFQKLFSNFELIIVHNIFTTHFNLPLTRALHDLSANFPMLAWTHDLTATNTDYALPNPTKNPWNLMRTCATNVRYIAVSQPRADEIMAHIKPPFPPIVVPNPIDLGRVFTLSDEMRESLSSLALDDRDFVFLQKRGICLGNH